MTSTSVVELPSALSSRAAPGRRRCRATSPRRRRSRASARGGRTRRATGSGWPARSGDARRRRRGGRRRRRASATTPTPRRIGDGSPAMRRPANATTSARRSAGRSGRSWATSRSQNAAIRPCGRRTSASERAGVVVLPDPRVCGIRSVWRSDSRCGTTLGWDARYGAGPCGDAIDELVGDVDRPRRPPGPRAGLARPRRPRRRRVRGPRRRVHAPLGGRRAGHRPPHVGRGRAAADGAPQRLRRRPPGEPVHACSRGPRSPSWPGGWAAPTRSSRCGTACRGSRRSGTAGRT